MRSTGRDRRPRHATRPRAGPLRHAYCAPRRTRALQRAAVRWRRTRRLELSWLETRVRLEGRLYDGPSLTPPGAMPGYARTAAPAAVESLIPNPESRIAPAILTPAPPIGKQNSSVRRLTVLGIDRHQL